MSEQQGAAAALSFYRARPAYYDLHAASRCTGAIATTILDWFEDTRGFLLLRGN